MYLEIYQKKSYSLIIENSVTEIKYNDVFLDTILSHDSLELFKYKLTKDEEGKSIDQLYQLDIKINEVGKTSIFFLKDAFNKDELLSQVSALKEMPVSDIILKKKKVDALLAIISQFSPIFLIFNSDKNVPYGIDNFTTYNFPVLYVKQKEKKVVIDKKTGEIKQPSKFALAAERVWKEKFIVIFLFISTLITGFCLPSGIYNCYINNVVYIFFFIMVAACTILSGFIYRDLFKKEQIKSPLFVTGLIFNILGVGAGFGFYSIYFNALTNVPEVIPNIGVFALYTFLISIVLIIISIIVPIVVEKLLKKNTAK